MPADPRGRDFLGEAIRAVVKRTFACGVVMSAEAWTVKLRDGERRTTMSPRLADDPRRVEIVYYTVEHLALRSPRMYSAPILRDALGNGRLGPFVEPAAGAKDQRHKGRFADLLDRNRFA